MEKESGVLQNSLEKKKNNNYLLKYLGFFIFLKFVKTAKNFKVKFYTLAENEHVFVYLQL